MSCFRHIQKTNCGKWLIRNGTHQDTIHTHFDSVPRRDPPPSPFPSHRRTYFRKIRKASASPDPSTDKEASTVGFPVLGRGEDPLRRRIVTNVTKELSLVPIKREPVVGDSY
ncbi:hypothetical protein TNCV_169441 [Trichonephila clavipes]|nr:hypothetical protein TNCV_169441 [Trichonephila clavipes]